jgi:hypothetical protein
METLHMYAKPLSFCAAIFFSTPLCFILQPDLTADMDRVLAVVALLTAIVALVIGLLHIFKIERVLAETHLVLDRTSTQLTTLKGLEEKTSTHYVNKFPEFIAKIIELIEGVEKTLVIFCDIPAYGNFSDPHNFEDYRHALADLIDMKNDEKGFKLELVCLGSESRLRSYNEVLDEWETWRLDHQDKLREYLLRRKTFWFGIHLPSEAQLGEKLNSMKKEDFKKLLERANEEMLGGPFSTIEAVEIEGRMPIFFWLADEREAIFSIPANREEDTELGFSTCDPKLIKALLAIRDRYRQPVTNDSIASTTL